MIKVELINKDYIKDIYKNWGMFSCQCYNTPKKYAEKVGRACAKSGHFSGSRAEYFKFEISGISRACSLQLNRHGVGVVLNQQSQRYVDMKDCDFVVPPQVCKSERAMEAYSALVELSKETYSIIQEELMSLGRTKEQANEDARFSLLESCETTGTWAFTLEALIHFMNKRLCSRSQWEIRKLANEIRKAVLEVLPELAEYLVPQCEKDLFCIEEKCCGRKPTKQEFVELINNSRREAHV